jgi:septum formation protein
MSTFTQYGTPEYNAGMKQSDACTPASLLLASASPRRIEMLKNLGIPFSTCATAVDESVFDDKAIGERVVALARLKAQTGMEMHMRDAQTTGPMLVIGADTLVSVDGVALGKAADKMEAGKMLRMLSGRTHTVSTGLCVIESSTGRFETALSETLVVFKALSEAEIGWYLETGEWSGAAGAYRIQEHASYFVERVEGSFSGVVGLPLHAFYAILCALGYRFPTGRQVSKATR